MLRLREACEAVIRLTQMCLQKILMLLQEEAPQEGVQEAAAAQHASELQAFRRQVQIRDEQIRQQEDELMALRERLVVRPQYLYHFHLLVRL